MTETATTPRVLSLAEVGEKLDMKRPNVAKFLARRGIKPAFAKAQGYFWWERDIERVKAEREADSERLAADERRREAALRNRGVDGVSPPASSAPLGAVRLGARQRAVLAMLSERPVRSDTDAVRLALRRLRERGLVEPVARERGLYVLTEAGRLVVNTL